MGWDSNPSANARTMTGRQRATFRAAVFARHGDRCIICHEPATAADHVIPIWKGGDPHDPDNGQPLCDTHHAIKSRLEAAEARRMSSRPSSKRPTEKHPGLR